MFDMFIRGFGWLTVILLTIIIPFEVLFLIISYTNGDAVDLLLHFGLWVFLVNILRQN